MEIFIQSAGWVGTFLIMLAYFLVSNKKVESSSQLYQVMIFLGAIGVGINVFHQRAWPAVALQITWGIIAIVALVKSRK